MGSKPTIKKKGKGDKDSQKDLQRKANILLICMRQKQKKPVNYIQLAEKYAQCYKSSHSHANWRKARLNDELVENAPFSPLTGARQMVNIIFVAVI